jgi:hypothetical protein
VKRSRIIIAILALAAVPLAGAKSCKGDTGGGGGNFRVASFGDGRHYPGYTVNRDLYISRTGTECTIVGYTSRVISERYEAFRHTYPAGAIRLDLRKFPKWNSFTTAGCGTFKRQGA